MSIGVGTALRRVLEASVGGGAVAAAVFVAFVFLIAFVALMVMIEVRLLLTW